MLCARGFPKIPLCTKPPIRDNIAAQKDWSTIIEVLLRAESIVRGGGEEEPYGTGTVFEPNLADGIRWWPMRIGDVHPSSHAAEVGIMAGDYITAVDGKDVRQLSVDGTFQGLFDPKTYLCRGFGGPANSVVKLSILRGEGAAAQTLEFEVRRNIWSARHLGTPPHHARMGQEGKNTSSVNKPIYKQHPLFSARGLLNPFFRITS